MSADGSLIVGDGFIWRETTGLQLLNPYLASIGAAVPGDLRFGGGRGQVIGISDDGTRILGWGVNSSNQLEGWLAVIPSPGGLAVLLCTSVLCVKRRR
jgi:hypothetical protein